MSTSTAFDDSQQPHEDMSAYKLRLVKDHIVGQLRRHRQHHTGPSHQMPPLIVGMQGPQGSGKTTLTTQLKQSLEKLSRESLSEDQNRSGDSCRLSLAICSVDDLYLPFEGLQRVAQQSPNNRLLQGRGQPGTHDLELGSEILASLKRINAEGQNGQCLHLPIFDKSQHGGRGDRAKQSIVVNAPVDVVLLEGWCLGFKSLTTEELSKKWDKAQQQGNHSNSSSSLYFTSHTLEDLKTINSHLAEMEKAWYSHIDAYVQLVPLSPKEEPAQSSLHNVFQWRLQAEHAMKDANGGKGMSDEQVHSFIERYMPGYELFGNQEWEGAAIDSQWKGRTLRIALGREREVLSVQHC